MAKGDDIEERLIDFAVKVVKLCDKLPKSYAGRHMANQLLRSGTAPAAHYAEARGAESTNMNLFTL
jgi:four helix bundle protein